MKPRFPHAGAGESAPESGSAAPREPSLLGAAEGREDRACCCPARPVVQAIMPPERHSADLLLCGHHYRVSRQALAAAGARIFSLPGSVGAAAAVPPDSCAPAVPSEKGAPSGLGTGGPGSVLVGIDGSAAAARAGWYAAGLARRQGAGVTAVFVARLPAGPAAADGAAPEGFPWAAAEEARRGVEEVFREMGVPVTFVAASGDPFTELCRVAEDIRADAVVVGASARAGHRLAGSLSARLVKAGRWPVTVVP
jgi:nucleotide-binding universal stress UspA family protein